MQRGPSAPFFMLNWITKASQWIGPGLFVYLTVSCVFIFAAIYAIILLKQQNKLLKEIKNAIKTKSYNL